MATWSTPPFIESKLLGCLVQPENLDKETLEVRKPVHRHLIVTLSESNILGKLERISD